MYNNIGGKIKSIAKTVAIIGIIASILVGLLLAVQDEDVIIIGVLVMVAGSFLSWVSTLTLYGFGQLIENTDQLVAQNDAILNKSTNNTVES